MRPKRSRAARTAASASARLVTSSLTASRSSDSPTTLDTRSRSRPEATTAWPAARAALAKSTPMPRPAPVMNQTLFSVMLLPSDWPCVPSAPDQLLQVLGVAGALQRDLGGRGLDVMEVLGRQLQVDASDVLLQPRELSRARDRNDPRLLSEQPGKRDLSRRRL